MEGSDGLVGIQQFVWLFLESVDQYEFFLTSAERHEKLEDLLFRVDQALKNNPACWLRDKGNYGLVIAMRPEDLKPAMADIITDLNDLKVPVKLWLLTSDTDGYWTNVANLDDTQEHVSNTLEWITGNDLSIAGIGLDLELPISLAKLQDNPIKMLWKIFNWNRAISGSKDQENKQFSRMVRNIPYPVECYVFQKPLHSFMGGGLVPPTRVRIVSMDYVSLFPSWSRKIGFALLRAMSFPGSIPAIGIHATVKGETPGRKLGSELPGHLTQKDLVDMIRYFDKHDIHEFYFFALHDPVTLIELERALLATYR